MTWADEQRFLVQLNETIRDGLADIAAAIRERRDADDNLVDNGERCKRCGLPEWDCDCDIDPPEPYFCDVCGAPESQLHDTPLCGWKGTVAPPPLYASFPQVSTQRGGLRFGNPADHFPTLSVPDGGVFVERIAEPLLLQPAIPGAPPPERPNGIQFDPIPTPVFKAGDVIRINGEDFVLDTAVDKDTETR